jgi:hypothetical protein
MNNDWILVRQWWQTEVNSEHLIGSDPPEGYYGRCNFCRSLNIECLVSDYGSEGKLYDLDALIDAASHCKTCERVFNLRVLRRITGARFNNSVRVSFETRPRVDGCCGVLLIKATDCSVPNFTDVMIIAEYTTFTNAGDIAFLKHGLVPLHTVGANTSSAESFSTARTWLSSCIEGHQGIHDLRATSFRIRFGRSTSETGVGPARLIDVFAQERDAMSEGTWSKGSSGLDSSDLPGSEYPRERKETSRIVDRADVQGPYLALSYMWGTHPYKGYITTNANLLARRRNIVEHELPKTFRHALHAARILKVRYLWIDAVCIIQEDEQKKDWLQESEKMGSIYANALMTLFAAGAKHSEEGMFNESSTYGERDDNQLITLHTSSPGSTVRSTLHFVPSGGSDSSLDSRQHKTSSPLLDRAWCLQEDLLSTRKLYYAKDQLYWECDHLAVSEDGLADQDFSPSLSASSSPSNVKDTESVVYASRNWYRDVIGLAYSKRTATKADDRLIAVAGLARRAANTFQSRYLAGLWQDSVLEGLLWELELGDPFLPKVSPLKTRCEPSWSWASWQGGIRWRNLGTGHDKLVTQCAFVRAHVDLLSNDEYGSVKSGTLVLRAKVIEVVLKVAEYEREWRGVCASCSGVRGWARLDEKRSPSDTKFLAIPILEDVSLLVTEIPGSSTYRRVGIWTIENPAHESPNLYPKAAFDCPADYLRWTEQVLPIIPVTEITIA